METLTMPIPVTLWDGFVKGVNFSIPGTGGAECVAFIPTSQKIAETIFALFISFTFTFVGWSNISTDMDLHHYEDRRISLTRQLMLTALCLVFGVEVGYKLSTSTVIWLANPCHLLTMTQIVLLAAPPMRWVTIVFRVMMHSLHVAVVAILLPVTNTRMLTFEVVIYWVQHIMIVTIPIILLYQRGPYTTEPFKEWGWSVMALGILYFIYWIPVQGLCILTEVNLNNMVCPAISDPFYGRFYRLIAMGHCAVCILGFGKLYTYLSLKVIDKLRACSYTQHNRSTSLEPANGISNPTILVNGTAATNGHATKSD
ncbi:transmembrane protein 164-like [Watersipora subatra]|uniref:transmembrane protein 164-like n=1 Tax=Watersipora subatra TaxID=2589382 RepID=UPI00355B02CE